MIIGYFGNVRQGKTLSAVREVKRLYDKGYKIYSNTPLSFPYTPLTVDLLYDIVEKEQELPDDSVFFIDEIHVFGFDSRTSMSKKNRVTSYFILQSGKLGKNTDIGVILIFTSQYPDQIDKRLKHVLDVAVECEKIIRYSTGEKYFVQNYFVYKGSKSFTYKKYFKGTDKYYSLYDTRKRISEGKDKYTKTTD